MPRAVSAKTKQREAAQDQAALAALDERIRAMLPEQYQCYADVQPVSMGTASLKYGPDGKVAWDDVWTSFCDLGLAGGPPHRGTLLPAVAADAVHERPKEYQAVVDELARAIYLVTRLRVLPRLAPGWIGVLCASEAMAAWLARAIIVENVFARRERACLHLPAGPHFRIEKEVKNVVTALAKTHHYWTSHSSSGERAAVQLDAVEPACPDEIDAAADDYRASLNALHQALAACTDQRLTAATPGWLGVECGSVDMAIWLLRAVLVDNILARREEQTLYLPAGPRHLAEGKIARVAACYGEALRLWHIQRAS